MKLFCIFNFLLLLVICFHHNGINGYLITPFKVPSSLSRVSKSFNPIIKPSITVLSSSQTAVNNNSPPTPTPEESAFQEEQELIKQLNAEILQDTGFELEDLINPSKVVNLRRDIIKLEKELNTLPLNEINKRQEIEKKIENKRATYLIESRAVMRSWLKNLFVIQSVIAGVLSYGMVTNTIPGYNLPLSIQVLGFWMWWLFIIPSLRARKPRAQEKDALNISFLLNPLVTLILPTFTKDVVFIWEANLLTLALCYVYGFTKKPKGTEESNSQEEKTSDSQGSDWWIQAWKALDYGSGQERGARK
mmetsp:Transcript_8109/g.8874  ORF Transcript_8109/g.8874 Transcript_8109/m.8874 type:complete len:305 (+) Transcript_8109:117-1031(+)